MTTPTTNYGWLKPDPTEPANITVIDTLLDDMDADIKAVETALGSKIYTMAQYRIKRKFTYDGAAAGAGVTSSLNDLWEEEWRVDGNTGNWVFPGSGKLQFTEAGIYKFGYQWTIPTLSQSVTSGTVSVGLHVVSSSNIVPRTKTYIRSNTTTNVTEFPRTTCQGNYYIWAGPGSDQCLLNTEYYFSVQTTSTSGDVDMIITPNDLLPFRSQLTIECVRPL